LYKKIVIHKPEPPDSLSRSPPLFYLGIEAEFAIANALKHGDGLVLGTEINSIILIVIESKSAYIIVTVKKWRTKHLYSAMTVEFTVLKGQSRKIPMSAPL
jgi:hypothetical protein